VIQTHVARLLKGIDFAIWSPRSPARRPCERIAENGMRAFRFAGAVNSHEQRGVGDVADEGFAGAHPDNDIRSHHKHCLPITDRG